MLTAGGRPDGTAEREGLVDPRRIFYRVPGATREEVLDELSARLAAEGAVGDPGDLVARLIDRERLGCTGLGGGVAIPHCKLKNLGEVVVAVATTAAPVDFGTPSVARVRVLVGPKMAE